MHRFAAVLLLAVAAAGDIFSAVQMDSAELLQEALDEDPSELNRRGPGGQTPLMNAVLSGKSHAVAFLLQAGADPTIPEKDGYTPPHGAGFQGRAEIARLLHAHGINIDVAHSDGNRPIQRACWGNDKRHADTVKTFVELGAALAVKDCRTSNPHTKSYLASHFKMSVPGAGEF